MERIINQIIQLWGEGLVSLPSESFRAFNLPVETKNFLSFVGLPRKEASLSDIARDALQIDFYNLPDQFKFLFFENKRLVIIAEDAEGLGVKTCIEEDTGKVFHVADFSSTPIRFMNSGIEQLLLFLGIYITEGNKAGILTKTTAFELARKLKNIFNEIDPVAMVEARNFWPQVIDPIEHGYL